MRKSAKRKALLFGTFLSVMSCCAGQATAQQLPARPQACPTIKNMTVAIGKEGVHLFLCVKTELSDGSINVQAAGATSPGDGAACAGFFNGEVPGGYEITYVNADIQRTCRSDFNACMQALVEISQQFGNPSLLRLFVSPLSGAPCQKAVEAFAARMTPR